MPSKSCISPNNSPGSCLITCSFVLMWSIICFTMLSTCIPMTAMWATSCSISSCSFFDLDTINFCIEAAWMSYQNIIVSFPPQRYESPSRRTWWHQYLSIISNVNYFLPGIWGSWYGGLSGCTHYHKPSDCNSVLLISSLQQDCLSYISTYWTWMGPWAIKWPSWENLLWTWSSTSCILCSPWLSSRDGSFRLPQCHAWRTAGHLFIFLCYRAHHLTCWRALPTCQWNYLTVWLQIFCNSIYNRPLTAIFNAWLRYSHLNHFTLI